MPFGRTVTFGHIPNPDLALSAGSNMMADLLRDRCEEGSEAPGKRYAERGNSGLCVGSGVRKVRRVVWLYCVGSCGYGSWTVTFAHMD